LRVTLVYPFYGTGRRSRYFPFGLAYVAASLVKVGVDVSVVDMEGDDLTVESAVDRVVASSPDIVGFGGMVTRYRIVRDMARRLRELLPGVFIVAGNSGATTLPELYLKRCNLDAVVSGEGEATAVELVAALDSRREWREVPGLAFLDGGELAYSAPRKPIADLDSLPFPEWDLFPVENYIRSMDHRQKTRPHMEVVASRGCPYGCVYCYRIFGRRVRRRSPASIVGEIKTLADRYGIEYTGFPDDLFTSDRDFVLEVCSLMRKFVPNMKWSCIGRVNLVDPEMLREMRRAGCDWISYGIESGSDEMLKRMKRMVTSEDCLRGIRMTREAGIHAEGSFIVGMFGETDKTVAETVEFCRKADITAPMLYVTPYPGTEIFREALEMGLIDDVEKLLESMDAADRLLVNLTDMPDDELIRLKEWAQGVIGRNYLMRRPLSRIPALLWKHYRLKGMAGLLKDAKEIAAGLPDGGKRRTVTS